MIKWQLGLVVAVPCMYIFKDILGWNNLVTTIMFQFIGAVIFFKLDSFIFKHFK